MARPWGQERAGCHGADFSLAAWPRAAAADQRRTEPLLTRLSVCPAWLLPRPAVSRQAQSKTRQAQSMRGWESCPAWEWACRASMACRAWHVAPPLPLPLPLSHSHSHSRGRERPGAHTCSQARTVSTPSPPHTYTHTRRHGPVSCHCERSREPPPRCKLRGRDSGVQIAVEPVGKSNQAGGPCQWGELTLVQNPVIGSVAHGMGTLDCTSAAVCGAVQLARALRYGAHHRGGGCTHVY